MQKIEADDPDYWSSMAQFMQDQLDWLLENVQFFEGVHAVKRTYGCELDANLPTRTYDRYSGDGKVIITLDVETGSWTAPQAGNLTHIWESTGHAAKYWKSYLEDECMEMLKKLLSLVKKDGGSDGRPGERLDGELDGQSGGLQYAPICAGIGVAFILFGVGIFAFCFCKKKSSKEVNRNSEDIPMRVQAPDPVNPSPEVSSLMGSVSGMSSLTE